MNQPIKISGKGRTITITPCANSVVVTVAGRVIADSARALVLHEGTRPPVFYIPRRDVDMTLLTRSDHTTHCSGKGDVAHYSIVLGGARTLNAAWSYEAPHAAVAAIRGHLAFYPDRVDSIVEWPAEYGLPLPGHDPALGPVQHAGQ